jgi:hypothetical protein
MVDYSVLIKNSLKKEVIPEDKENCCWTVSGELPELKPDLTFMICRL